MAWFKKLVGWCKRFIAGFRQFERVRTITVINLRCKKCNNNTVHHSSILSWFGAKEHSQPVGMQMTNVCLNCGEISNAKLKLS